METFQTYSTSNSDVKIEIEIVVCVDEPETKK